MLAEYDPNTVLLTVTFDRDVHSTAPLVGADYTAIVADLFLGARELNPLTATTAAGKLILNCSPPGIPSVNPPKLDYPVADPHLVDDLARVVPPFTDFPVT